MDNWSFIIQVKGFVVCWDYFSNESILRQLYQNQRLLFDIFLNLI